MPEKRTLPKKILLISANGETISSAIINKLGQTIGWAVRGLAAPAEGGGLSGPSITSEEMPVDTNGTKSHDANLDY